jgi:type III restriction enzyme
MEANDHFFERPILNNPYLRPVRHWELDGTGQPIQKITETRRRAEFITPIPKPRKRKGTVIQRSLVLDEGKGLSTAEQRYELTSSKINDLRGYVEEWRKLPQIEAGETTIWLSELAPKFGKAVINHLGDEVVQVFRVTP